MRGECRFNSLWIIRKPLHCPLNTMPTTIKYNDLTESIAASLQYINQESRRGSCR